MPIHKLVPGQPNDANSPLVGQILPRPEPVEPPPEPDTTTPDFTAELTRALGLKQIKATDRMVLRDQHGRVLCIHAKSNDWGWVYLGEPERYGAELVPLVVHLDPTSQILSMSAEKKMVGWSFFADGNSTAGDYVFAGFKVWQDYPRLRFRIKRSGTTIVNHRQTFAFTLSCEIGSTRMAVQAPAGKWGWVKLVPESDVSDGDELRFSLHKLSIPFVRVRDLIKATWPNTTLTYQTSVDSYYEAISAQQAHGIWVESGLKYFKYKPEVFDCDDFALAYKTKAARTAYSENNLYPYSVGIVFGQNEKSAHAANLFIDQWLRLQLLEPQTGAVQRASEWAYTPYHIMF